MKAKILTLLRERADYVSGQELCEQFGVSRTAVWKAINQLKKEGFQIEAVQNKGYLLINEEEIFGQNELNSRMHTTWAGKPVYFHETIGSTNLEAKKQAEEGAPEGTLIVADMQTAGRGRRGRSWESPAGTNVYFTLILKPDYRPEKASMVTLVMALAVADGIYRTTGIRADIKWPNDIVIEGRKVCGMLTELSMEQDYIQHVVVGVGINVGLQEFAPQIKDTAACLEQFYGKKVPRATLVVNVMEAFEKYYEIFRRDLSLTGLMQEYNERLVSMNREVRVLDPQGEFTGTSRGINDAGELLVETADGSLQAIYAGEVSVRGIYGYV